MNSKLKLAIIGIRISSILYFIIMLFCLFVIFMHSESLESESLDEDGITVVMLWVMAILAMLIAAFLEVVIVYLRKRKFWAWIAGLVVAGIYVPSLFLPLGILIFIGLLAKSSRQEFGVSGGNAAEDTEPKEKKILM